MELVLDLLSGYTVFYRPTMSLITVTLALWPLFICYAYPVRVDCSLVAMLD